jgi:hypothetical protein
MTQKIRIYVFIMDIQQILINKNKNICNYTYIYNRYITDINKIMLRIYVMIHIFIIVSIDKNNINIYNKTQ